MKSAANSSPELAEGEYWFFPDERDDDDPTERALFDYQRAFQEAGDTDAATEFEIASDAYRELPIRSRQDFEPDEDWHREEEERYVSQGHEPRQNSLVPPPKPSRSIFDDVDG
jgi:hypothetical protein